MIDALSGPPVAATTPVGTSGRLLTTPASSTIPVDGVCGVAPMSASTLVVICWIRESGSPTPAALGARPRFQWFVPVLKTSAPLGAVYFVMLTLMEPLGL